ncbi:hypothetical protein GCM10016234_05090 [Tianweitania populi]|uniref:Uncharacterized protein n=1 Tax=Tianweitania populi TaxID=1607949 RepID=A0A8J3GID5_9HYPH|nr:hypothetical protein GCM10016234_05090 [Tianweitania populi]
MAKEWRRRVVNEVLSPKTLDILTERWGRKATLKSQRRMAVARNAMLKSHALETAAPGCH